MKTAVNCFELVLVICTHRNITMEMFVKELTANVTISALSNYVKIKALEINVVYLDHQ